MGGGDVAVEDAIFLARVAKQVYVVHRRDALRATKALQSELFSLPNVTMVWDSIAKEIKGDNKVDILKVENVKTNVKTELNVDGVFVAVGIMPESQVFTDLIENRNGYLIADETCETSLPGVFAVGDVRTKQLRQISTAVADGANAITSVDRYLTTQY